MPLLPHPTWPPHWFLICGAIGVAFHLGALCLLVYSAVHYILKFW